MPQPVETGARIALDDAAMAALASIHSRNPQADPLGRLPDVSPARLPRHIAIIMDGNGRWATAKGLPRQAGHQAGARSVRKVVEECGRLGVEVLTLYSFSMENWRRPRDEVQALMELCLAYLASEEPELVKHQIRFRVVGRREGLPPEVVRAIARVEDATRHGTRATLCLAINYGSRAEIADAARAIAADIAAGTLRPQDVNEAALEQRLSTSGLPDPDLLIRTAGEMRVSNFLLWQISYSELYVTPALWPDFGVDQLHAAIRDYARRNRRYGGIENPRPSGAEHA